MKISACCFSLTVIAGMAAVVSVAYADSREDAAAVKNLLKADAGAGAAFGARDPYACPSSKPPETGAPTAAQARAYVIGQAEYVSGSGNNAVLHLTENVTVEIGKGRPYQRGDGADDIDMAQLVYPIRGTLTVCTCYPISVAHPQGQSCKKVVYPKAEGLCYKTTFGDWKCSMMDVQHRQVLGQYFPAPR